MGVVGVIGDGEGGYYILMIFFKLMVFIDEVGSDFIFYIIVEFVCEVGVIWCMVMYYVEIGLLLFD